MTFFTSLLCVVTQLDIWAKLNLLVEDTQISVRGECLLTLKPLTWKIW